MNNAYRSWEEAILWLRAQEDMHDLVKNCFYDDPLCESAERYHNSSEWKETRRILSSIKKGEALDIGAGRGISSYALAKDGWKVTSLEPDGSDIVGAGAIKKLASESGLVIRVVEEWGETLPFDDNSFDLVYARQALHHAKDLYKLCREIRRVLRHDGRFIAVREHVISREKDLAVFLRNHPLHRLYGGENAFTLDVYKNAIKGSSLKIKKILGPHESDINLFPSSREGLRESISQRLRFRVPGFLLTFLIPILNAMDNTPGRLYSFVGYRL